MEITIALKNREHKQPSYKLRLDNEEIRAKKEKQRIQAKRINKKGTLLVPKNASTIPTS